MKKIKNDILSIIFLYRSQVTKKKLPRFARCICAALAITFSGMNFSFADAPKGSQAPIAIKTEIDKHSIAIGDKIKYTIAVSCAKNIEVEFPDFGKNLENFAIKDFGSSRRFSLRKQSIKNWYLLDTYVTGESIIPKAVIKYRQIGQKEWQEAEIPEQKINVKSILKNGASSADVQDIEDPIDLPQRHGYFFIISALILAAILSVSAVIVLKAKNTRGSPRFKPAHEIAYEQLTALKKKGLIAQGKIMEFYIEISDIARHYIENRFNIKAPEMTTEEFFIKIKEHSQFQTGHKALLKEFLACCDLVKFAKYAPSKQEIEAAFGSTEKFIEQTKEEQKEPAKLKKNDQFS